jgi:chemotaxis signal transduction protein
MEANPSSSPASGARRGGVLVRVDDALAFVPASVALRVAPAPRVTPVPGAPAELLGVTAYEGIVLAVIAIGTLRREMIVCQHAGELVGLVGAEVVQTGAFDAVAGRSDLVEHRGERAQLVDVSAIYGRVQANVRPGRWAR